MSSSWRRFAAAVTLAVAALLCSSIVIGAPPRRQKSRVVKPPPPPPPPALDVPEGTRLLVIAPHPDDEVLEDAVAFAGVSKYPARIKCALLGWMAWKDATARAAAGGVT